MYFLFTLINLNPKNKTSITQLGQVLTVRFINLSFLGSPFELGYLNFSDIHVATDVVGQILSHQSTEHFCAYKPWIFVLPFP